MYETSGFDEQTKNYLRRIILSIFITALWLMINAIAGLYFKLAIVEDSFSIGNIFFYLWFALSFIFYLRYMRKLWKGHLD